MYENETGASPFSGGGGTMISNTDVQDARCESYDIPYVKSGAPIETHSFKGGDQNGQRDHKPADSASTRYNIRRWIANARHAASLLSNAISDGDFMDATSAGVELTDSLRRVWRHRSSRESEFAEVVNLLQIALVKVDFETLSVDQCKKVVEYLNECILAGAADEETVRLARTLLRQANLDPWRGLSLRGE